MRSFTVILLASLVGSTTAVKVSGIGEITREVIDTDTGKPVQEGHKRQLYEEEMDDPFEDGGITGLPTLGEYHYEDGAGPPEVGIIPTRAQMEQAERLAKSKADFIEVPEMQPKDDGTEKTVLDTAVNAATQIADLASGNSQTGVAFKQTVQEFGNAYVDQVKGNIKMNEDAAEDMAFHVVPNVVKQAKQSMGPTVSTVAEMSTKQALNNFVGMAGQAVNAALAFR